MRSMKAGARSGVIARVITWPRPRDVTSRPISVLPTAVLR